MDLSILKKFETEKDRSNKIIRQELRSTENDLRTVHSDIKLWRKSMHDFRKKKLPTIPKSLEESKFQLFNSCDTLKTNTQEHFCYMEEISNIVVFTRCIKSFNSYFC
ncbi:hypothetical protein QTP88_017272 [Uroleucon formosanum]